MTRRLGILGGTFDPVHLGHLTSARETAAAFQLDRVTLLLSAYPPHKADQRAATVSDRLAMLQLAIEGDPLLEACDLEARRPGPSYTYDTLADLGRIHRDAELYLIVGIDAFKDFDTWYRAGELLELANVIVTTRPGHPFPAKGLALPVAARQSTCYDSSIGSYVHKSGHVLASHEICGLEISSTAVRHCVQRGLAVEHLTGPAVAAYIERHRLYEASRH